jgi:hypothetical protein
MSKKNSRKHQKIYKMKGCSKTRRNHLGGNAADLSLAYPSNNVRTVPNPFLAYTGKGGASCSTGITPSNLAYPQNVNGANPAYPNTGPPSGGFNFLNPQGNQHGGGCNLMKGGNCGCNLMSGGCGPLCGLGFMSGGKKKKMKGGRGYNPMSNNGIPYPNGLAGAPYDGKSIGGWPGVDGVGGNRNYYTNNTYNNDVSRQMIDVGANKPFLGFKGGKRSKKQTHRKKQKGGTLSNFIGQDLINLGRQVQFGVGSAYNALAGYQAPINPMPWKGQLPNTASLSSVKAAYI